MLKIAEKWQSTWGRADSAGKEETRDSGSILRLRGWGWHVISHLGVPDHGTYGFGPSNHHPPTPGAPKDHLSSTNIAGCRYPRGGGGGFCRERGNEGFWLYQGLGSGDVM